MKKILVIAVLALLAVMSAQAVVITNSFGQVVTYTVGDDGVTVSSIVTPNVPSAGVRSTAGLSGIQIDTNSTTTVTQYTPRDVGDILFGFVATTGTLWGAVGYDTNSWSKLTP